MPIFYAVLSYSRSSSPVVVAAFRTCPVCTGNDDLTLGSVLRQL